MKIGIITGHNSNFNQLAKITLEKNKIPYSKKYGYPIFVNTEKFRDNVKPHFDKIHFILHTLENNNDIDWFWWIDTDTMITNFNIKLEDIIKSDSFDIYHCIIGSTVYNWQTDIDGINNGSFFIKNTNESKNFLKAIIEEEPNHLEHPWQDQGSMIAVLKKYEKYRSITKFVLMRNFNSLDYEYWDNLGWSNKKIPGRIECDQWHPGDFVIHWAGVPLDKRLILAEDFLQKVIY